MTHLKNWLLLALLALGIVACNNDDPNGGGPSGPVDAEGRVILEGEISQNRTLIASEKYILRGQVYVTTGATLTIEPGTVILGDKTSAGTLVIEQGARIDARGTATQPIVFTSAQPAGSRGYGDWGGVVIFGSAPANRAAAFNPEGGVRVTGTYGGDNPNDNSGTLQYVRIEFAGIPLTTQTNSEINGLTLYGVGAGTTIDHIQVSYCGDDSFEWFGGTVNSKYLVAYRGFDDDFDTDHGYSGKVQFAVSLRDPSVADQSGSNGLESDNYDPGTPADAPRNGLPLTAPVFANTSVFAFNQTPSAERTPSGSGAYTRAMHLRRNTAKSVFNSVFVGYPEGLRLDGTATLANAAANQIQLRGIVLANTTKPLAGAGGVTDVQVQEFFNNAASQNQIVPLANLGTLGLNANQFNLNQPTFLPAAGSPLLTGAVWTDKGADAFFEKVPFRGAFGTTDWTTGWTNFNPQQAQY
jgi:hypothetical protein